MSRVTRVVDDDWESTRQVMGLVAPNKGRINEVEFPRVCPDEYAFLINALRLKKITPQHVEDALPEIDGAVKSLVAAGADMIIVCGMPLAIVPGPEFDEELIDRVESIVDLPVTTMATSVVDALEAMEARDIVVVTPYSDEIDQYLVEFLEADGIDVRAIDNLGLEDYDPDSVNEQDSSAPQRLAEELLEAHPEADGCFISSGGLRTLDIVEPLEEAFDVPVTSSGQASIWNCLRLLDHQGGISGYGSLLENHL